MDGYTLLPALRLLVLLSLAELAAALWRCDDESGKRACEKVCERHNAVFALQSAGFDGNALGSFDSFGPFGSSNPSGLSLGLDFMNGDFGGGLGGGYGGGYGEGEYGGSMSTGTAPGMCVCKPGFEPDPERETCVDIDECARQTDLCPPGISKCVNLDGDYACVCSADLGWENAPMETKVCQNLNECEIFPPVCGLNGCCRDLPPPSLVSPASKGYMCAAPTAPDTCAGGFVKSVTTPPVDKGGATNFNDLAALAALPGVSTFASSDAATQIREVAQVAKTLPIAYELAAIARPDFFIALIEQSQNFWDRNWQPMLENSNIVPLVAELIASRAQYNRQLRMAEKQTASKLADKSKIPSGPPQPPIAFKESDSAMFGQTAGQLAKASIRVTRKGSPLTVSNPPLTLAPPSPDSRPHSHSAGQSFKGRGGVESERYMDEDLDADVANLSELSDREQDREREREKEKERDRNREKEKEKDKAAERAEKRKALRSPAAAKVAQNSSSEKPKVKVKERAIGVSGDESRTQGFDTGSGRSRNDQQRLSGKVYERAGANEGYDWRPKKQNTERTERFADRKVNGRAPQNLMESLEGLSKGDIPSVEEWNYEVGGSAPLPSLLEASSFDT